MRKYAIAPYQIIPGEAARGMYGGLRRGEGANTVARASLLLQISDFRIHNVHICAEHFGAIAGIFSPSSRPFEDVPENLLSTQECHFLGARHRS
ncbi:MAG: hypothetical protein O7G32_00125, partial [SAR324 cluster bacterium]|nr:hypothetical protein [SAR324 cluster bacterium]